MTATMTFEKQAAEAAEAHQAKGTACLGTLLVIRSEGIEIPVTDAEDLARDAGLPVRHLPRMRERSAITKALHQLKITASARHGGESDETGSSSCLRYSRVPCAGGDVIYSVQEERVEQVSGGLPRVIPGGEVQRLAYFAKDRRLEVYQDLLREEIKEAYAYWKGAYKSDSIRSFLGLCLDDVKAVKFAGSTWFVPQSQESTDMVDRLRRFSREVVAKGGGGLTYTAVQIMDEPGGKEDLLVSSRTSIEAEMDQLVKRLADCEKRKADGVQVRDGTVDRILDDGRVLREKLRSLATLLNLESKSVTDKLEDLDKGVRALLGV